MRSDNCLKREGIRSVGELVARSEADLLDIRNFGAKPIDEVKMKLVGLGPRAEGQPARVRPVAAAIDYGGDGYDDEAWTSASTTSTVASMGLGGGTTTARTTPETEQL